MAVGRRGVVLAGWAELRPELLEPLDRLEFYFFGELLDLRLSIEKCIMV